MKVAGQIRRMGFRRWYERQLVEGHAYLVIAFLALILLLAGVEGLDFARRSPGYYVAILAVAAAAGVVVVVGWRRFNVLLQRAELFASGAGCPQCKTWGKFDVLSEEYSPPDAPVESGTPHWLRVKCRNCGTDWRIG
jgi:Zn ribbon nucleic-acid-binding protein